MNASLHVQVRDHSSVSIAARRTQGWVHWERTRSHTATSGRLPAMSVTSRSANSTSSNFTCRHMSIVPSETQTSDQPVRINQTVVNCNSFITYDVFCWFHWKYQQNLIEVFKKRLWKLFYNFVKLFYENYVKFMKISKLEKTYSVIFFLIYFLR